MVARGLATLIDEADLIRRARAGEEAAFGELVRHHTPRVIAAARRLVRDADEARDLSQEAFVRAFRARESLDPARPFYPWLLTILRRLCANHHRDRSLGQAREAEAAQARAAVSVPGPAERSEEAERRRRLREAIAALDEIHREMIVLKDLEGLRYREIAELLGIPVGTVMSRLSAARYRLTLALKEDGR